MASKSIGNVFQLERCHRKYVIGLSEYVRALIGQLKSASEKFGKGIIAIDCMCFQGSALEGKNRSFSRALEVSPAFCLCDVDRGKLL